MELASFSTYTTHHQSNTRSLPAHDETPDPTSTSKKRMFSRALAIWLLLLIVAVIKGAIREIFITPRFGEQAGHIGGTAILCAVIILVAWFSISWIGPNDRREALVVGTVWVALTVAFVFLRAIIFRQQLGEIDCRLRGRIWMLVLVVNLFAPLWAFLQKQPV
jgi:hypothetical protein